MLIGVKCYRCYRNPYDRFEIEISVWPGDAGQPGVSLTLLRPQQTAAQRYDVYRHRVARTGTDSSIPPLAPNHGCSQPMGRRRPEPLPIRGRRYQGG